ncbi:MAG: fructosamine kinase family protein [Actinomycetota bacterium]
MTGSGALDHHAIETATGARPVTVTRVAGGDVAESFRVELDSGITVFAKTHRRPPPGFFTTEAAGLSWLRAADAIPVPEVLGVSDEPPILILSWIDEDPAGRASADEAGFGRALAALHGTGAETFGRTDGRTTGSRRLPNDPADTWVDFFAERRLLPLARLAADDGALAPAEIRRLESVAADLADLAGPPEPPARLHGDLWAGNRLVDRDGRSWLIDPACFGGHREFDLAMMRLFGGFDPNAFAAYDEVAPLADGWPARVPLWQLAPLVVHAIKFGGGYRGAVSAALDQLGH